MFDYSPMVSCKNVWFAIEIQKRTMIWMHWSRRQDEINFEDMHKCRAVYDFISKSLGLFTVENHRH